VFRQYEEGEDGGGGEGAPAEKPGRSAEKKR
jgi:hypothetical protein